MIARLIWVSCYHSDIIILFKNVNSIKSTSALYMFLQVATKVNYISNNIITCVILYLPYNTIINSLSFLIPFNDLYISICSKQSQSGVPLSKAFSFLYNSTVYIFLLTATNIHQNCNNRMTLFISLLTYRTIIKSWSFLIYYYPPYISIGTKQISL